VLVDAALVGQNPIDNLERTGGYGARFGVVDIDLDIEQRPPA
jgi:hypothetical protein